jgi:hypothetical protein
MKSVKQVIKSVVQKLSFNEFLKLYLAVRVINTFALLVARYFQVTATTTSYWGIILVNIIGIALFVWWFRRIQQGGRTAYGWYWWLTLFSLIVFPINLSLMYFVFNLTYWRTLFDAIHMIFSYCLGVVVFLYITEYWRQHFEQKSPQK